MTPNLATIMVLASYLVEAIVYPVEPSTHGGCAHPFQVLIMLEVLGITHVVLLEVGPQLSEAAFQCLPKVDIGKIATESLQERLLKVDP